jgi:hypothetical protein
MMPRKGGTQHDSNPTVLYRLAPFCQSHQLPTKLGIGSGEVSSSRGRQRFAILGIAFG